MGQLIWNVVTTSVAVVAIIVGVALYFRQKKEKEPTWAWESHGLVGPVSELGGHLKMSYDETPVTQVTSTRILFWNAGRDSILKSDIAKAFSVRFLNGIEILECRIVSCSRPEIGFQTQIAQTSIGLDFKFLGHGDGARLEVLHTGPDDVSVKMSGSLVSDARAARLKAWPSQAVELRPATVSSSWRLGIGMVAGMAAAAAVEGVAAVTGVAGVRVAGTAVVVGAAFIVWALRRRRRGYLAWLGKP